MDAHAEARHLRAGVVWNLVPVILLAIVGLGLNFVIGRFWGAAALGAFNQVTAAYFVLAAFGAVGINFSVLRAVAARPRDPAYVGAVVVGGLVPSVLLGVLVATLFVSTRGWVARLLGSEAVAVGILWATPGLFCFIVNKLLLGVVNGLSRMRAYAVYTSLRYLLIALGLGLGLALQLPPEALPGLWSFSEGALFLVLAAELLSTVSLRRCQGWSRWLREHVHYGLRGFAAVLLFEINSRLDIWMLGPGFSDAVVGVYSMAASMAEGASQLPVVLQVNVNPQLAAQLAAGRHAEVQSLISRTRRWFVPAMAALSVLAMVLYPLLIPWLTGHPEFGDGALPFALLMAGLVLSAPWLPYNQILLMGSRPGWHTVYVALAVAANVLGCSLLIPHYGPVGAAASTAASLLLSVLLLRRMASALVGVKL
jgi:O-antigen/teichoic acid export membrane protein